MQDLVERVADQLKRWCRQKTCKEPKQDRPATIGASKDTEAGNYTNQEWKDTAIVLDEYLHFDDWKITDEDPYYDWRLVRKVRLAWYGLSVHLWHVLS